MGRSGRGRGSRCGHRSDARAPLAREHQLRRDEAAVLRAGGGCGGPGRSGGRRRGDRDSRGARSRSASRRSSAGRRGRGRSRSASRNSSARRRGHHSPALETFDALGQGLERQVALGPRAAGKRDLQNKALVHGRAHLAGGVTEHGEHAGQAVAAAVGRGLLGKLGKLALGHVDDAGLGAGDAHHIAVAHAGGQLARELQQVTAVVHELGHAAEQGRHVPAGKRARDAGKRGAARLAQQVAGRVGADVARAEHGELLERGERVAHAAAGVAHYDLERLLVIGEALGATDLHQVVVHLVGGDGVEVEALHAREDRGEDLLRVGGAHDEDHVLRRLLEGLEQRVERRRREHVDLVDDVDLVAAAHRGVVDAGDDLLADVVDAGAARGIQLVDVGVLAGGDELALLAGAVGQVARALLAHEGLGDDARHGGLARAARPAEQVGVARAVLGHGALEGGDHVGLANYLLKRLWAILAIQRLHATSGNRRQAFDARRDRCTSV